METIFMKTENNKTSKPRRFKLDLTNTLDLIDPKKNIPLANLSIYYTWKNIKLKYNNNKFEMSSPTWNDTFDLLDSSYSIADMQGSLNLSQKKTQKFH